MSVAMLRKLVTRQFKSQRHVIIPFILALSMMFGMEYILISLELNDYIHRHSETLVYFFYIANTFIFLLTIVFVLYANRFMMRHREREFAMNMILGMEKKHLRIILLVETLYETIIILVISIIGGYLFGSLVFMLLNKLLGSTNATIVAYPFSFSAMGITCLLVFGVMLFLYAINATRITFQSSINLINAKRKEEKTIPWWLSLILLIVGSVTLFYSYQLVLTPQTIMGSLGKIFIAIFYLVVAMYCLFIALNPLILKLMQKNKRLYYHPRYFFTISGLTSRLRSNAIGLASISLLCTFILTTLSMCVTSYRGIDERIDFLMNDQYRIEMSGDINHNDKVKKTAQQLKQDIQNKVSTDRFKTMVTSVFSVDIVGDRLQYHNENQPTNSTSTRVTILTEDELNDVSNKHLNLKDNEVAVQDESGLKKLSHLTIAGKQYKVKPVNIYGYGLTRIIDGVNIVVKDKTTFNQISNYYHTQQKSKKPLSNRLLATSIDFNVLSANHASLESMIPQLEKKYDGIQIQTKKEFKNLFYIFNSGLVFIGLTVSLILLIGTFLIMYFKQIAEGYEDKDNFELMQKMGIDERRIKQTIRHQMLCIFALPMLVGTIHTLVAIHIINILVSWLGIRDIGLYLSSYIGVLVTFIAIYGLMYWVTSRMYYQMISYSK